MCRHCHNGAQLFLQLRGTTPQHAKAGIQQRPSIGKGVLSIMVATFLRGALLSIISVEMHPAVPSIALAKGHWG